MRKWKQKWIRGTRGAISLLLVLLLLPFYSLAAVLVEAVKDGGPGLEILPVHYQTQA